MIGRPAQPPALTGMLPGLLGVLAAGLVSGGLGALAAGHEVWRPLGHLVGPWVLLTVVVAARQPWRRAVVRGGLLLSAAVVAFYVTLAVMRASPVRTGQLALWCVLAVLGGMVLGLVFHRVGRGGTGAVAGTACALGLLVGDVLTAIDRFGPDPVLLGFVVVAVGVVLALARPTWWELLGTVALTAPASAIALLVVAAPDDLERLLVFS